MSSSSSKSETGNRKKGFTYCDPMLYNDLPNLFKCKKGNCFKIIIKDFFVNNELYLLLLQCRF